MSDVPVRLTLFIVTRRPVPSELAEVERLPVRPGLEPARRGDVGPPDLPVKSAPQPTAGAMGSGAWKSRARNGRGPCRVSV